MVLAGFAVLCLLPSLCLSTARSLAAAVIVGWEASAAGRGPRAQKLRDAKRLRWRRNGKCPSRFFDLAYCDGDAASWKEAASLIPEEALPGFRIGEAVTISGDGTILVGSFQAVSSGAVYVFRKAE